MQVSHGCSALRDSSRPSRFLRRRERFFRKISQIPQDFPVFRVDGPLRSGVYREKAISDEMSEFSPQGRDSAGTVTYSYLSPCLVFARKFLIRVIRSLGRLEARSVLVCACLDSSEQGAGRDFAFLPATTGGFNECVRSAANFAATEKWRPPAPSMRWLAAWPDGGLMAPGYMSRDKLPLATGD